MLSAAFVAAFLLLSPFCAAASNKAPTVSAYAAAVIEAESGRILYEKNGHARLPMASTTKIMTAATVIMIEKELERIITVSPSAAATEGSRMGLNEGDSVTLKDLLYGLMLSSGNDAATAICEAFCNNALIDIMNTVAREHLELKNTNFTNCHGLPDENHYSSACDMAAIMRFALNFEKFCEITAAKTKTVAVGNRNIYLKNHNRLLSELKGCDGGKTGYTEAAGRCLVTTAERDGVRLICVTLKAPDDWEDHKRLYDFAFSSLKGTAVSFQKGGVKIAVTGGNKSHLSACYDGIVFPVFEGETIESELSMPPFLYAPVFAGEVVGRMIYRSNGKEIASAPVYAEETVVKRGIKKTLSKLFLEILL